MADTQDVAKKAEEAAVLEAKEEAVPEPKEAVPEKTAESKADEKADGKADEKADGKADEKADGKADQKAEEADEKADEKAKERKKKQLRDYDHKYLTDQVHKNVQVEVEHDRRNTPDEKKVAPVTHWKELDGLKETLLARLIADSKDKPSPVQKSALPITLTGRNVIIQAPSGTGKTITFTLTILQNIDETKKYPQAVVVAPTLELAVNIHKVVEPYSKALGVECQLVRKEMRKFDYQNPQVIVGTPGKLTSVFQRRSKNLFLNPTNISIFVVDEADKMLAGNLSAETRKVKNLCKNVKQVVLCSATFDKNIKEFTISGRQPFMQGTWSIVKVVGGGSGGGEGGPGAIPSTIQHFMFEVGQGQNKVDALCELYTVLSVGQSFVFVNNKEMVPEIARRLGAAGIACATLYGEMGGDARDKMFKEFANLEKRVLVCTNVGSRGLDIVGVTAVINFDLPQGSAYDQASTYVHRAGRSGRFGRDGVCVTMVTNEMERSAVNRIIGQCKSTTGEPVKLSTWKHDDFEEIEDQIEKLKLFD